MRNNLLSSAVFVFAFWWLVLTVGYLFGETNEYWSVKNAMGSISISFMSVAWGMAISIGIFVFSRLTAQAKLVGSKVKGINVSMGPFPESRKFLPRCKRVTAWHPSMADWIRNYADRYPEHMALLNAVAELLDAHPLHPASIEPGGHGDRTLLDHSHYVAEFMLKGAYDFEYKGVKMERVEDEDKAREVNGNNGAYRQIDPLYKFNPNDPIIPILGLAHDIGKIECYEISYEGVAYEKRSQHDWRGRFVLTCIPEFWDIPQLDREALLDAVGFYHHPAEMPMNVADRPRALVDLVVSSDMKAGEYEAAHPRMATPEDVYEMVKRMLAARGEDPTHAALPDRSLPYSVELNGVHLSLHQSRLLYFFEEMMFEKGSINGGDTAKRIGIKIGDIIYFEEEPVRERLGKLLMAKKLIESSKKDSQKILTSNLMEVLGLKGVLISEINGHEFSSARSLFKLRAGVTTGKKTEYEWPAVFMVDAKKYEGKGLGEIEDVDFEVLSVVPVYPWDQARKKSERIEKMRPKEVSGSEVVLIPGQEGEAIILGDGRSRDATDGIARELFERGQGGLASGIEGAIDAANAIPETRQPKDNKRKREKRRVQKSEADAASPVNTSMWWEVDDGKEMIDQMIFVYRETSVPIKVKEIDGVNYGLSKLKPVMSILEIPMTGEDKVLSILNGAKNMVLRQNADGDNFLGIAQTVLENP